MRQPTGRTSWQQRICGVVIFGAVFSGLGHLGWTVWSVFGREIRPSEVVRAAEPTLEEPTVEKPPAPSEPLPMTHLKTPAEVRGLYWTAATAGSDRKEELLVYMAEAGINTVVIDLKMDNGELAFLPNDENLKRFSQEKPAIEDLDALLRRLGEQNLYRVARIAVMRDGAFAVNHPEWALKRSDGEFWKDSIGSLWVDPAVPEIADYALALGREAFQRGFDEVQFDYVRFPSDGRVEVIHYPVFDGQPTMVQVMQTFFKTVGGGLRAEQIPVSFDVFGITLWSTDGYDYNIGQRLVDIYPYADFISPMVYPSHYPADFEGYKNPALYPYEVVKKSLDKGAELLEKELEIDPEVSQKKFRPWLQDFDIGAVYDAKKIEEQIRASREAGASGWMLWNARNVYEPADYWSPPYRYSERSEAE
ncbi:hypothetical protein HY628_01310 [Candidatus Uhrbacteria bacterium]|nr:hypothetical protein [Candidatus Uhrbacteria bacterium]